MKSSRLRGIFLALSLSLFVFSVFGINFAVADSTKLTISNASIKQTSGTASLENFTHSDQAITGDAVFHDIGDSILLELTINNDDASDYRYLGFSKSTDDAYLDYTMTGSELVSANSAATYELKISYARLIEDISAREHSNSIKLTFDFERIEDAVSPDNPRTIDQLPLYVALLAISITGIIICIIKKRKTHLAGIVIAVACACCVPAFVSAISEQAVITINITYDLASKLEVTYDIDGAANTAAADYGKNIDSPTPVKDGHTFDYWADENGKPFDGVVVRDITLTAVFKKNYYTISYDYATNGGNSASASAREVAYQDTIDLTPIAEKTDWNFIGWNTDASAHDALASLSLDTAADLKLYAIFDRTIDATFDANNNTLSGETNPSCTIYNNDTTCEITAPTINSMSGVNVLGFSTSGDDHENIAIQSGAAASIGVNQPTYYAQTETPAITRTAHWDANGINLSSTDDTTCEIPAVYNNAEQATSCSVTIPTFSASQPGKLSGTGFNYDKNATNAYLDAYNPNGRTKFIITKELDNLTWYAVYEKTVTVHYVANGNTLAGYIGSDPIIFFSDVEEKCTANNIAQSCEVAVPFLPSTPIGYSLSANDWENLVIGGSVRTYNADKSIRLYAQAYQPHRNITVHWQGNGIELSSYEDSHCEMPEIHNQSDRVGCTVDAPTPILPETYEMLGFSTYQNWTSSTSDIYNPENHTLYVTRSQESDDLTYYAIYKHGVKATFVANGNTINKTSAECSIYNAKTSCRVFAPTITALTGFTALGFSSAPDDHDGIIAESAKSFDLSSNTTYYAQSKKDGANFVAHWDANGATLSSDTDTSCSVPAVYNGATQAASCKVSAPTVTAPSGSQFVGFNLTASADENHSAFDKDSGLLELSAELTDKTWYAISKADYNVSSGAKVLAGGQIRNKAQSLGTTFTGITAFKHSATAPDDSVATENIATANSAYPVYIWWEGTELNWYSPGDDHPLLSDSYQDFLKDCRSLSDISGLADFDSSAVANLNYFLQNATNITSLDVFGRWNTANLQQLKGSFLNLNKVASLSGLENWDTSKVNTLNSLFSGMTSLTNIDAISGWNTSSVTDMSGLLAKTPLTSLAALSDWNTSKVESLVQTFQEMKNLTSYDGIGGWDVSKVKTMDRTFNNNVKVTSLAPISGWQTTSLTNMNRTFAVNNYTSLEGVGDWDVSHVTVFSMSFDSSKLITSLANLGEWDVSNAENMNGMFYNCSKLNNTNDIIDWDVQKVTNFSQMFKNVPGSVLPTFSLLPGAWDSNGTYTPSV